MVYMSCPSGVDPKLNHNRIRKGELKWTSHIKRQESNSHLHEHKIHEPSIKHFTVKWSATRHSAKQSLKFKQAAVE